MLALSKLKTFSALACVFLAMLAIFFFGNTETYAETYSGECGGEGDGTNLTWTLTDDGMLTIKGTGKMKNYGLSYDSSTGVSKPNAPWGTYAVSIKKVNVEYGVTSIGNAAFAYCDNLISATIPDSVTSIGAYVFRNCAKLSNVTIGNNVATIGKLAFAYCSSLNNVVIPNSVSDIGDSAFYSCSSLTSIIIPDSVEVVGIKAFYDCNSLTSVAVGNGAVKIGWFAFNGCDKLLSITFKSDKGGWWLRDSDTSNVEGYIYLTELADAELSAEYLTNTYTKYNWEYTEHTHTYSTVVTAPTCKEKGYTTFTCMDCQYSFKGAVTEALGHSVGKDFICDICGEYSESIFKMGYCGKDTDGSNISWIITYSREMHIIGLGEMVDYSIISIPWYDFRHEFEKVIISDGVTHIGSYSFADCKSLESVVIPQSVTSIGESAFRYSDNLKNVYITELKRWCGLSFWEAYSNPLYFSGKLYVNDKLINELVIPEGVTHIGDFVFCGSGSLESVIIPEGTVSIGKSAFMNCDSLTYVNIGNNVERIERNAFRDCDGLTSVNIPNSVKYIGPCSFFDSDNLNSVNFSELNGWAVYLEPDETGETNEVVVSPEELADSSIAANFFRETYWNYFWDYDVENIPENGDVSQNENTQSGCRGGVEMSLSYLTSVLLPAALVILKRFFFV